MNEELQSAFNIAYLGSLPPAIAGMMQLGTIAARSSQAAMLAPYGYIIDVPIQVWLWDPFLVMTLRQQYGYATVPDASGTKQIKVSVNPLDFPAYELPPVANIPLPAAGFPPPPPGKVAVLTPFGWMMKDADQSAPVPAADGGTPSPFGTLHTGPAQPRTF